MDEGEEMSSRAMSETGGGGDAAELFGMAQLAPGEGIEDAVRRIEEYLAAPPAAVPVDVIKLAEARGFNGAIRYVLGYFNGAGDRGSTAYEEILNACGREQIIRSAVGDGELEFTGLGWYVENYGTEQDRNILATHPSRQRRIEVMRERTIK